MRSRIVRCALAVVALGAAGCAAEAPQSTLEPASDIARQIDGLWDVTFALAVAVFVLVEGALVYTLFRFRAKRQSDEPTQIHGNTRLEIAWTILPAVLLAGLAVPTVGTIFSLSGEPADPVRITVTGFQWWWAYEYPDHGVVTANELHIPVDRPVYLSLESVDVIHSFWAPRLAGKQDVVPGRTNTMTIMAEEPGEYYQGQCAEYCGLSHANMRLRVYAHSAEDFEAWVDAQREEAAEPTEALAQRGKELFEGGACVGCHVIDGVSTVEDPIGPNLTHLAMRDTFAGAMFELNEENLTNWLADPPEMKPGSKMPDLGLADEDIEALVAYLMSLE